MSTTAERERWRECGLCTGCGKVPPHEGGIRCDRCRDIGAKNTARKIERARTDGICCSCYRAPHVNGRFCAECHQKSKDYKKNRSRSLFESGMCITCGRNASQPNHHRCAVCILKGISRSTFGTTVHHEALKQLLIDQDYKCPYSGATLIIGVNTSIDHIVPKSRGGTNDMSNLQWVDLYINKMKLDKTDHTARKQ
jgi:hypothetical protein